MLHGMQFIFSSFLFIGLACSCKTGCKTKRCSCYKGSKGCSDLCKCPSELCSNKGQPSQANSSASSADEEERVVLGDKTNNISANSTACNTMLAATADASENNIGKKKYDRFNQR